MAEAPTPRPVLAPEDALFEASPNLDAAIRGIVAGQLQSPVHPGSSAAAIARALPGDGPELELGTDYEPLVREVTEVLASHSRKNAHPGFFGYVCASGLPSDPVAHAIVAALNQNVTGFDSAPSATIIEQQVVSWIRQRAGFPEEADGYFVAGGSQANLIGIASALHSRIPALRRCGFQQAQLSGRPRLYATAEAHFSLDKATVLLGLGSDCVVRIPTDGQLSMDPVALDRQIGDDIAGGDLPIAVIANAGSTTTGAIDPLSSIAQVCAARSVWLHVDAAYGGGAALWCPELRDRFLGIECADSMTFDFHKWLYVGLDSSVILMRNPRALYDMFATESSYAPGAAYDRPEDYTYYHQSPETSRRFRALPAYLALRRYGSARLGRNILFNVELAEYLAALVEADPRLELTCRPQLGITCFRYTAESLATDAARRDTVNEQIRQRLIAAGDHYLSATRLRGEVTLRVCIASPHTRAEHIECLVSKVVELGDAIRAERVD